MGLPVQRGSRTFYVKRSHLYFEDEGAEPQLLLENVFQEWAVSVDGRLLAFGRSESGSDQQTWRIMEVETRSVLDDRLESIKFPSVSWAPDGAGLYYNADGVFLHRIGTLQTDDELICTRAGPIFSTRVTDAGDYLVVFVSEGADRRRGVLVQRIGTSDLVELFPALEARYEYVRNVGERFWFLTTNSAPRGRIVEVEIANPHPSAWKEVIAESDDTIRRAVWGNDRFHLLYLVDGTSRIRMFSPSGDFTEEIDLPEIGTVSEIGGSDDLFFSFSSFDIPPTIFRNHTIFHAPKPRLVKSETNHVFYSSRDGTGIPMFIASGGGVALNDDNPVYLTGYGGFGEHRSPMFSPPINAWLEMGGAYALACVRGGGEYGEEWHEAGRRRLKQNAIDDFIAAAEWLISNGYTSPRRLAIGGGSNGGLLAAAALVQRPDLFGAAVITSGVLDMLRFTEFTVGWAWTPEYGSPSDRYDFEVLRAYSPLHNLERGREYPATLVVTGDHDDRVWPGHSFKFAAAMQEAQGGGAPVLIHIESKTGHGKSKPKTRLVDEHADAWSFVGFHLGLKP